MSSIIIASIIIRWIAVFWSVLLLVRLKDWRMGFFSVMFALMAVCQGMTLRAGVETISMELSGVAVSIMGLLAVIFLKRIITKQLKDEGELRSAYNQTEYLLSSSPAVIYTCKPSDDYAATYISPNVKEQMGYDPEDFTGNSGFWADHIHPEDKSRIFAQLPRFFEQGRHAHEYRFQFKDGAYRWMRDELKLMRDKDGRPLEIVGYWIDITERKEMETALMKSKAFVSQTEKITKAGGWEYDIVAKKLTWSDEVYRLHGVSKETYDPNSIEQAIQFYAQEDQKILWEAFQAAVERGEPYDLELQFNPADGGKLWVRTIGEVEQKDGRVVRVFGNIMDITDSKKAEEALRQEHAFSDAILESLPGVFYLYDENRRFLRWNRNFTRITGYTDAEMAHRHPLDFFAGPDKELLAERIQEVFTEGGSDAEADFVAKDGTRIPYYFTGLKAMINGKVCLLGVGIDNTKRKKIAAELRKHREHLEKLVKERTAQLEEKLAEIERMNRIFTGREMRMVELKEKIKELEARIGDL